MKRYFLALGILCLSISCSKDFLDKKPNKALAIPTTLNDMQAMLDNDYVMNTLYSTVQEFSSDDFYILDADWNIQQPTFKSAYLWQDDVFNERDDNDWSYPYITVQYANIVLDAAGKYNPSSAELQQYNSIKGSALFFRAHAFYWLAQVFAQPYNPATASSDLGIALRYQPGIGEKSVRASVAQTYDQVLQDAKEAVRLLPLNQSYKNRPNKAAAYGLLARVYLAMADYPKASLYADSCLQLSNTLLDYNTLNTASANPVPRFNQEVIFHSLYAVSVTVSTSVCKVDSTLFRSYAANDLRRTAFFKPTGSAFYYVGSYNGSLSPFNGITTSEMLLVRAESKARAGDKDAALNDLNALLLKRYKTGTFVPVTAASANDALITILKERRKELIFRGSRWTDLRRLNKEPQFAITLTRINNGKEYRLPPNDPHYTFIIPQRVIDLTGMPQTPR
jgi:starch-binding outer membrane protein, SusD/RagB family